MVLSGASILGLQSLISDPAPFRGVWEGILWHIMENYKPQFVAGCRHLVNACYAIDTGSRDKPPAEKAIVSCTILVPTLDALGSSMLSVTIGFCAPSVLLHVQPECEIPW